VHLDKEQEFLGKEALRREKEEGLRKKLVGFKVEGRGIARHDYPVAVDGETVGSVTSGTLSPTLNEAIGLALVAPEVEDEFEVVIRDRPVAARTVPLPFYKREKK
jgi:aminomethyltransferase